MRKMRFKIYLILILTLALSACGAGREAVPTLNISQIQTLAIRTYQAQLTQTAQVLPSATPPPTNTLVPVVTFASPNSSPVAFATSTTSSGASSACNGLSYVKDVTIPDNTQMTPGQAFTKTWLVANTGSCNWEPGFIFNIVGGDAMGGVAVTLNQTIQPGRQYEFSIPMVAPSTPTGEIKGTWRLADANGIFFGDGVYLIIEVGSGVTLTPIIPTP
ncbi:MAG: NBR1-Ig-like domain-containing protein [Anaerolineae bacterium]|nr:NBR1-Ig-like domain-containing protein [Anaerolineae bacterium]